MCGKEIDIIEVISATSNVQVVATIGKHARWVRMLRGGHRPYQRVAVKPSLNAGWGVSGSGTALVRRG